LARTVIEDAMIDAEILKVLACPYCITRPMKGKTLLMAGELELVGAAASPTGLKCKDCNRVYPIDKYGVPYLLIECATVAS
jgi:uncharacterized protein YbaR (Trm112 family)